MARRRRARALYGTGQGPPPTVWGGKPLFGGPWGRSNFNEEPGYNGPNGPQGSQGYQPSYDNNFGNFGGAPGHQGSFNSAAPPPPPYQGAYQGGNYGPGPTSVSEFTQVLNLILTDPNYGALGSKLSSSKLYR